MRYFVIHPKVIKKGQPKNDKIVCSCPSEIMSTGIGFFNVQVSIYKTYIADSKPKI
jgi:hypothetical protein